MAKLESLNFEVILHDEQFNAKIGEIMATATKLNESLTNILNFKGGIMPISATDVENAKKLNKIYKDILKTEQEIKTNKAKETNKRNVDDAAAEARARKEVAKAREQEAREVLKTQAAQERLNRLQREGHGILSRTHRLWREVGSMAAMYFSIRGAWRLVSSLTRISAEFEYQRVTLGAILNDTQAAGKLFNQMKELAVQSPFQFKDLVSYAKQLSAYSIPVEELYDTTKMLADVSSGLGVGMDRLVLAYGQIRSASFLRGQEVRQLTEAGIPILEELRKQFVELGEEGITVGDVFDKISKRMVPFEMVEKVFKNMTSEGGKFFEMQEVQAATLKGKISNLTDAYQIMFSEIGDRNKGVLVGVVDAARSLATNYEKVGRVLTTLIVTYGSYRVAIAATTTLHKAHMLSVVADMGALRAFNVVMAKSIKQSAAWQVLTKALKSPWAILAAGATAALTYYAVGIRQANRFKRELDGIADAQFNTADKSANNFKTLVDQLRKATVGSQNYRDAISKLNNQYSEYLPNLLNEKNALEEIARVENEVVNSIRARARAYAEAEGLQKIEDKEGKKMTEAAASLIKALKGRGMAEEVVDDFVKGFRDRLKENVGSIQSVFDATLNDYLGTDLADRWRNTFVAIDNSRSAIEKYGVAVRNAVAAEEDFTKTLDLKWGAGGYSNVTERERMVEIERNYSQEVSKIMDKQISEEQKEQEILNQKIIKLNSMITVYETLNEEISGSVFLQGQWNNKIRETKAELAKLTAQQDMSWIQKLANQFATGSNRDLAADISDSYAEYADKIRDEYKKVTANYKDAADAYKKLAKKGDSIEADILTKAEENRDNLEERKKAIEAIADAIGLALTTTTTKTPGTTKKSQQQKDLEARRDTLKDIYQWYQKLMSAGMDKMDAKSMLSAFFPDYRDIIQTEDFAGALMQLADALERYSKESADALRREVSGNGIEEELESWTRAKKAAEDYEKFMSGWIESTEVFGEGAEAKIANIINRMKSELSRIDKERDEGIKVMSERAATDPTFDLDSNLDDFIDQVVIKKENAFKNASENIRKLADDWVKSWDGIADIDISHMADLTVGELDRLQTSLETLAADPEKYISDNVKNALAASNLELSEYIAAIRKAIQSLYNQAEEKRWAHITEQVQRYKKAVDISTGALRRLARAAGNTNLESFADELERATDLASNFVEALEKSRKTIVSTSKEATEDGEKMITTIEHVISKGDALMLVVSHIVDVWADAYANTLEFEKAVESLKVEMLALRYAAQLENGTTSIFGDNTYAALWNASVLVKQLESSMKGISSSLLEIKGNTNNVKWWEFFLAPTAPSAWAKLFANKKFNAYELLEQMGVSLMDETGRINVEALEKLRDSTDKWEKGSLEAFNVALEQAKAYNDALDQIDDAMESLVGGVADDFADAIISQWKAAGDAAIDYSDILGEIAESYAKMFIKNALIDSIFDDDFKKQITDFTLAKQGSSVLALFEEKAKQLEEYYPTFAQVLDGLSKYFTDEGTSDDNTLGGGIKSITEDTANLLASYVNAIRADVAAIRQAVASQANLNASAPTLAEYLTQIQANTYNTAQNTANLLADLRSMMTVSDGPALRVFM